MHGLLSKKAWKSKVTSLDSKTSSNNESLVRYPDDIDEAVLYGQAYFYYVSVKHIQLLSIQVNTSYSGQSSVQRWPTLFQKDVTLPMLIWFLQMRRKASFEKQDSWLRDWLTTASREKGL